MTETNRQPRAEAQTILGDLEISPDLADALARTQAQGRDTTAMSQAERQLYLLQWCKALKLSPLGNPLQFIKMQGGKEVLYVTRFATDQLAAMHRLNREIIDGPKVIDLGGAKLVYAVCRASHPNGRIETSTATVPLTDPVNVLMKCESKAKRRATLSILGLGLLTEEEAEASTEAERVLGGGEMPNTEALEAFRRSLSAVRNLADAQAMWTDRAQGLHGGGVAGEARRATGEHLDALGYVLTAAHLQAVLGGNLPAALGDLYEALARLGESEDFVRDAAAELNARKDSLGGPLWADGYAATRRHLTARGVERADALLKGALAGGGTQEAPEGATHEVVVVPETLEAFRLRVAAIELPGEAVSVWMKFRTELSPLPAADKEAAWKALCARTETVGKMQNAKVWLRRAIAEEDARRVELPSTCKTRDDLRAWCETNRQLVDVSPDLYRAAMDHAGALEVPAAEARGWLGLPPQGPEDGGAANDTGKGGARAQGGTAKARAGGGAARAELVRHLATKTCRRALENSAKRHAEDLSDADLRAYADRLREVDLAQGVLAPASALRTVTGWRDERLAELRRGDRQAA